VSRLILLLLPSRCIVKLLWSLKAIILRNQNERIHELVHVQNFAAILVNEHEDACLHDLQIDIIG